MFYFKHIYQTNRSPFLDNSVILKNIYEELCDGVVIFSNKIDYINCLVSVSCNLEDEINSRREISEAITDPVVNIISWEFAIPIKSIKTLEIKEKTFKKLIFSLKKQRQNLQTNKNFQNLERYLSYDSQIIFTVYRQAKNEPNRALKYFMFYRILELLIGSQKSIDTWLAKRFPNEIVFVSSPRLKHRKESLVNHFRNHIHSNKLLFPYGRFYKMLPMVEKITRTAIQEIVLK